MRIVAATKNKGKLAEFQAMLQNSDIELVPWTEAGLPADMEIEEDGNSCEENSLIKASAVCKLTGEPAMADDTGLYVEALGGAPGIYAARYAGEHCTEQDNRDKMLAELTGVPMEKRNAVFVTVITVVYPDGRTVVARGECPGFISEEERGDRGFGYDFIYVPAGSDKTFAELPMEYKNKISHRHLALQKLAELI